MGADIYLNSKFEKNYEDVQKEIDTLEALFKSTHKQTVLDVADGEEDKLFELTRPLLDKQYSVGYFRDSYNSSSLLSQLGLSWSHDIGKRLNEKSCLSVEDCKWFLYEINNRRIGESPTEEPIMSSLFNVLGLEKSDVELDAEKIEYFVKKKSMLVNLLLDAIELNEPLYCSI
jgi:hypothetical protein